MKLKQQRKSPLTIQWRINLTFWLSSHYPITCLLNISSWYQRQRRMRYWHWSDHYKLIAVLHYTCKISRQIHSSLFLEAHADTMIWIITMTIFGYCTETKFFQNWINAKENILIPMPSYEEVEKLKGVNSISNLDYWSVTHSTYLSPFYLN